MLSRILALSSSRSGSSGYLQTAAPVINDFIGSTAIQIAFIPFAAVDRNYLEYRDAVAAAFMDLPHKIMVALPENAVTVIEKADAIMVGGGNTFKLLHDMYDLNLKDFIQAKVNSGVSYIGWSAGANILCPTIATTNDMPIIEPKSFKALELFSFQVNPHYFNQKAEGFNGETRDQRLEEFLLMNPGVPVVGLPEGTGLRKINNSLTYIGNQPGVLFYYENENKWVKKEITSTSDLSFLL